MSDPATREPLPAASTDLAWRRRWKKSGVRLAARLVPSLYIAYMRLVTSTSRIEWHGMDEMLSHRGRGENVALALLHQDIMLGPFLFRDLGILTLANVGDAGDLIAAGLARLGNEAVRGGSSRRASRRTPALRAMIERVAELERGRAAITALTPDGSRGPAGAIKPGIAVLAAQTRSRIYCLNIHASRALYAPTWDRTAIPLPFSTIRVELEGPILPPVTDTPEAIETTRRDVEQRLHAMHARAFARRGKHAVPALTPLAVDAVAAEV